MSLLVVDGVARPGKVDVGELQPRLFHHLPVRALLKSLPEFQVAARQCVRPRPMGPLAAWRDPAGR